MEESTIGGNERSDFLTESIERNLEIVRERLHHSSDIMTKVFPAGDGGCMCAIVSLYGLSDPEIIHKQIVSPIQQSRNPIGAMEGGALENPLEEIRNGRLSGSDIVKAERWDEIVQAVLSGDTALMMEGSGQALLIRSRNWPGRSIEEPTTEALVRGSREGFTENLDTNLALVRKQLRDPGLVFETRVVGARSHQTLCVAYLKGIIHPDLLGELKRRLDFIDIDMAFESGTIEQWIEDSFLSPFPQIQHTERPDKVTAALLQGKAAILLDGTPFALLLPATFVSFIQSPEDYYERWLIGSLIRLLRYLAVIITLFLPSLYIALISFHQGMIPFKLAISIAASREGVPFPAVIEALLMEATLELLREAGIRLPKPIGQTIGIVGGLVIGEAAVQAGIVSPIMVIVVAVTAISSFTIPSYSAGIAFRMLRFATMLAASIFGLYGIVLSSIMISIHLARLYSFGVPYFSPITPSLQRDWRDKFIRAPITFLTRRPQFMQTRDQVRARKDGGRR